MQNLDNWSTKDAVFVLCLYRNRTFLFKSCRSKILHLIYLLRLSLDTFLLGKLLDGNFSGLRKKENGPFVVSFPDFGAPGAGKYRRFTVQ